MPPRPVKQVLVLQSFDRGNLILDRFTANLRVDLDQGEGGPVNAIQVVVGPTGFIGAPRDAVVAFIRSTFVDRPKPDLIVAIGGPAAIFARKYRRQLFPDVPQLLAVVDWLYMRDAPAGENDTAVAAVTDFPRLFDDMLHLLPQTRQVFMVIGSGEVGRFWRREFEEQFNRFKDRLTFIWSEHFSFPEILRRCASLPPNSAIFYLTFGTDAAGAAYADERVLADLHASANAPLFAGQSVYLGAGIVGGSMLSIDDLGRRTAAVASRLLAGASPRSINVPLLRPGRPVFDWRELRRWNIAESRLPPGSVVRYRAPSLWRAHRGTVLGAAGALAVQSLLIAGLLYQRRARRRAETDSRRHLALAVDASRRETMSALTSSIGHELGQPLASIMYNAEALQMMVAANRPSDAVGEILSDIQTQSVRARQIIDRHRSMLKSHELDKQPIDLHSIIDETLGLVAHDMIARHVSATVQESSSPCVVDGDQILLQQVLMNLVMNAVDALTETPPDRRHVTIGCTVSGVDVEISVRDTGPGVPAHILDTLFTPFVTTKAHGLGIGLTIVRSIVDAHGGAIVARNNPDGGATFTVTLRRSASTSLADGLH